MGIQCRISTSDVGGVTVVTFLDRKILDDATIQELGEELLALVEQDKKIKIVLSFAEVTFLSSATFNKLILLDSKIKRQGGKLALCDVSRESPDGYWGSVHATFVITRLNQLFDIKETLEQAMVAIAP